jgi:cytochrome c peroxidase
MPVSREQSVSAVARIASSVGILFGILGFLSGAPRDAAAAETELLKQAQQTFRPLPHDAGTPDFPIMPEKVELGRKLFFDPRISADGTVSCARCHQPSLYATDGLPLPRGVHDKINPRNAPTVLNAALQFAAHWRGDRKNVEDQAMQALVGPPSFGNSDYATAMAKLKAIPGYDALFKKAFPGEQDPINQQNWGKAIGAFERTLIAFRRLPEGRRTGSFAWRATWIAQVHGAWLQRLSRRSGGRRRDVPKIWNS